MFFFSAGRCVYKAKGKKENVKNGVNDCFKDRFIFSAAHLNFSKARIWLTGHKFQCEGLLVGFGRCRPHTGFQQFLPLDLELMHPAIQNFTKTQRIYATTLSRTQLKYSERLINHLLCLTPGSIVGTTTSMCA